MSNLQNMKNPAGLALAAALAALTALAACGVKSPPYPAAEVLPAKVRELTQTVTEEGELILKWLPPETNMAGRPLKYLGGFQVEMADHLADESFCLACPPRYGAYPEDIIPAADPARVSGPYEWRRRLAGGHVYYFRVAALGRRGGVHPEAKTETLVWALDAPGALSLSATQGDRTVELRWPRPAAGSRAEIEKRAEGADWLPLPSLDPAAGRFSDLAVAYEHTYEYRGRLIKVKDETGIQGPWTREIKIKVVDTAPPQPPAYLDAVPAEGGVRLAWESLAADPDAAGYLVYRRRSGEKEMTALTPAPIKENVFFDRTALEAGGALQYQVTAVDGSPRANESEPSPVAEVRLDRPPLSPPLSGE